MSDSENAAKNMTASKRRSMAQEALRVKINGEKHIGNLEAINESAKSADKDTIPGLRLQADISLALLKKVLPDLKHVEVTSDEDSPLIVKVMSYRDNA